jgi:N-acetylmuramoyl-L-alanine amidase
VSARLIPEKVQYIVVHCSATPPKVKVDRAVIDRWHRERGFLGIGYHYVVTRTGAVEVGRPLDRIGAHVEGHNERSVGICMAGGMDKDNRNPEDNFTPEQYAALRKTIYALLVLFPNAQVVGHRDLNPNKACPSFDAKAWWKAGENPTP